MNLFKKTRWSGALLLLVLAPLAAPAQVRCEKLWDLGATLSARTTIESRVLVNAAHSDKPTTLAGRWDFADLPTYSSPEGIPGAISLGLPQGGSILIRDLQYALPDGKVGLHLLPTVDRPGMVGSREWKAYPPKGQTADGKTVEGSTLVDTFLREQFGLPKNDDSAPLFAVVTYSRMQENLSGTFRNLQDYSQNRTTHMGAYEGKGLTRHSPYDYATTRGWENAGYPATLSIVTMKGVEPRQFNLNAQISLKVLNEFNGGVKFPNDYKFDYFRQINLKEVLDYYRGWVDVKWERNPGEGPYNRKLQEENSFHCYCSEHVTMALNIAANVPHNKARYQQIWGAVEGAKLFELARARYKEAFKEDMPETGDFTPLWERHGIKDPATHTVVGEALVWNPLTVPDLLKGFMTQYANWQRIGPVMSSLALMKFSGEAQKRLGLSPENYAKMAVPVMAKMLQFDVASRLAGVPRGAHFDAAFAQYVKATQQGFDAALAQLGAEGQAVKPLIAHAMAGLAQAKDWAAQTPLASSEVARAGFEKAIEADLQVARAIPPKLGIDDSVATGETYVQHYSPPHVVSLINNGLYKTNPHIELRTVGTTLPASEVRARPEGPRDIPYPGH